MSTGERRLFTMDTPDWGQTHLTSDAVVAFVDDELAHGPHARATVHVATCPECAAEVVAQRSARTALRGASCPTLPSSLLSSLRSIPQDTELPSQTTGLAVSADGRLVSVVRTEVRRGRGADRPQASPSHAAPPPGDPLAAAGLAGPAGEPGASGRTATRRRRFGAGAAMSGLAIGAMALGVTAIPGDAPALTSSADRGVLGGSVLGGQGMSRPARFGLDAGGRSVDDSDARLVDRAARTPRTFLRLR